MSLDAFLAKYGFSEDQRDYISNDFNRGSSHYRYNTTKQLFINKKIEMKNKSKNALKEYVDDITTRFKIVSRSTFLGWKHKYKIITK